MGKLFLAAFIVLVLLVLLLLWVISKIVKRLNEKVKADFLRSLNEYDEQIEKKSKELKQLRDEYELYINKQVEEDPIVERKSVEYIVMGTVENVAYKNKDFAAQYSIVKNVFKDKAKDEMIKLVNKLLECPYSAELQEYKQLREMFTKEIQYQLLTLPSGSAEPVLDIIDNHSKVKGRIIKEFMTSNKEFKIDKFIEHLDAYIYRNETKIVIISPTGEQCIEAKSDAHKQRIEYIKDENIVEGYVVKFRDRIYDFSI